MGMELFWVIVAGFFFIAEIATVGFLLFWVGVGAVLALITCFITDNIIIQTAVFVVSSIILIFATKPLVNKFTKKDVIISTNVYSIIGKKGIVLEEINPKDGKGSIKVNGEIWTAISEDDSVIPVNTEVEILEIKGVKALVTAIHVPNIPEKV